MKSNKTFILGIVILVILALMFVSEFIKGANLQSSMSNPMSQFNSISELQRSVDFKFQVPKIIGNAKNKKMYSYLGQMVEIVTDEATFRAARTVNENADVSGDYSEYDIDVRYIDDYETLTARYRATEDKTLININTGTVHYSIKFNKRISDKEAFTLLDINYTQLDAYVLDDINTTPSNTPDNNTENNVDVEDNNGNEKSKTFELVENKDFNISFMMPTLNNKLKYISSGNEIAVMLADKVIFTIEYHENGYNSKEYVGYSLLGLDNNFLIRYIVDNDFEKNSTEYKDYYTIIESMSTIKSTFNRME